MEQFEELCARVVAELFCALLILKRQDGCCWIVPDDATVSSMT